MRVSVKFPRIQLALAWLVAVVLLHSGWAQVKAPDAAAPPRLWTSSDGRTLQAQLVKVEGDQVTLLLSNGQPAIVPLARLSPVDRDFIKQSLIGQTSASNAVRPQGWPETVEVESQSIDAKLVDEDEATSRYVYKTATFEFTTQGKLSVDVMREIARTFEATHALVKALPWGIRANPPADLGLYKAKFYVNRRNYMLDGGPENSGGVYFSKDRVFRVPFESLGLKPMFGGTWFQDKNWRNDTIVHEITHQMMHDVLPFLPIWVTEGTAEYTEQLPYNHGKFTVKTHERGLKERLKEAEQRGLTPASCGSLTEHLQITEERWQALTSSGGAEMGRLYFCSYLLVYYFNHLDGDGKGTSFIKYMEEMVAAHDAWEQFFKRPDVRRNEDGSFTYPREVPLPAQKRDDEYGLSQLNILTKDRTPEQLEADIKAGFKKIGVRM